jgi:hypothetical protein
VAAEPPDRARDHRRQRRVSAVGNGAATRAGTVVAFLWVAFVGVRLLQKADLIAANGV